MQVTRDDGYVVSDDPGRIDRRWVASGSPNDRIGHPGAPMRCRTERSITRCASASTRRTIAKSVFAVTSLIAPRFAWLCDVFVDEAHRRRGLGVFLMEASLAHPDLAEVRRHVLITSTSSEMSSRFGYAPLQPAEAGTWMVRLNS